MYDGSTALILAARLAVEGMVEELITCHADVNAVDELGKCVIFPPESPDADVLCFVITFIHLYPKHRCVISLFVIIFREICLALGCCS